MQGRHPLPQTVINKLEKSGGVICSNVSLLSVLTMSVERHEEVLLTELFRQGWCVFDCTRLEDSMPWRYIYSSRILWKIECTGWCRF